MKKIIVAFVIVCWLHEAQKNWLETNVTKAMAFQMKQETVIVIFLRVLIGADGVFVCKKRFDTRICYGQRKMWFSRIGLSRRAPQTEEIKTK
jgi:hypothetical protein